MPVMILGDGMIGQMMEPISFPENVKTNETEKTWATTRYKNEKKEKRYKFSLHRPQRA